MKQLTLTELLEVRGGYHPDYSSYNCKDLVELKIKWINTQEEFDEFSKECVAKGCETVVDCF